MSTDGAIDTRILRRLDAGRIYNQQTESIGKMGKWLDVAKMMRWKVKSRE